MKTIIDNFSERAKTYAKFRPVYPDNLYKFIYSNVKNFENAWDCGTGNGQVALELSNKFNHVYATDISDSQLALAPAKQNIFYRHSRAEKTNFEENKFDLITVAQAFHWFDEDGFYKEVNRVAKHNSILAVWGYNLLKISPEIDIVISDFYTNTVGKYWDADRRKVEESYSKIQFPYKEIDAPSFEIKTQWNFEQLIGYLNSWSSVVKFNKEQGFNPIKLIESDLLKVWGVGKSYPVKFPLFLKLGKIE